MSDLICRKTMMRCQTPGMCAPYGGCRTEAAIPADQVLVPRELLERVEESLRCEIEERYAGTKDHPAIRPKYLRDIAEADELRAILQP